MFLIYQALRRHRKLAERRDVNFESNRMAKFFIAFTMLVVIIYLIGAAIILSTAVNSMRNVSAVEFFFSIMPVILTVDFFVRFMAQQTPTQIIRPYSILPIRFATVTNGFVLSSLMSRSNLIWFFLIAPYTLMSVVFGYGIETALLMWLLSYILILVNSQFYAIIRTLVNVHFIYWCIPIVVRAIVYSP